VKYPSTPATLQAPYTYSDFTGYQFRTFVSREGSYWRDYGDPALCGFGQVGVWGTLRWEAETPAGTHIRFEAQAATTADELGSAHVIVIGETPPETSPPGIDVGAALLAAGVSDSVPFLRLRTVLVSEDRVTSPVLHSVDVSWYCEDAE
jgi:hypothetical protein